MTGTNTCMGIYKFTEENHKIFDVIVKPLVETHTGLAYVDARSHYEALSIKMDLISRLIAQSRLIIVDVSNKNEMYFLS